MARLARALPGEVASRLTVNRSLMAAREWARGIKLVGWLGHVARYTLIALRRSRFIVNPKNVEVWRENLENLPYFLRMLLGWRHNQANSPLFLGEIPAYWLPFYHAPRREASGRLHGQIRGRKRLPPAITRHQPTPPQFQSRVWSGSRADPRPSRGRPAPWPACGRPTCRGRRPP